LLTDALTALSGFLPYVGLHCRGV